MAVAADHKMAISMDPLHAQVPAQRFNDERGWAMSGFAVPILFPEVRRWPWEAIAKLRRDQYMIRFRAILREVEQEAAAEVAAGGDIEAAAHHSFERHLAGAQETVESIGAVVHNTCAGSSSAGSSGSPPCGSRVRLELWPALRPAPYRVRSSMCAMCCANAGPADGWVFTSRLTGCAYSGAGRTARAATTDLARVSMTEDEYPLRLAAATRNPRCVAQAKLSWDISEEEGIRPGVSRVMTACCPFEVVPGTDLCVRHLNGEEIPGELT